MYFFPFLEWFINHISQMIIRLTTQMSLPFKVSTTAILCVHPKFLACCSTAHLSFCLHDSHFLCPSYNSLLSVFYKRCTFVQSLGTSCSVNLEYSFLSSVIFLLLPLLDTLLKCKHCISSLRHILIILLIHWSQSKQTPCSTQDRAGVAP